MVIEQYNGVHVLRDDLLPGGTKSTFLHLLIDQSKKYIVYASPVYGGMQIALAHYCSSVGKQAVIFCAKRKEPHANTLQAKAAGAMIIQVPHGYLSNVQSKAKEFVKNNGGQLLPFGANTPEAVEAIGFRMRQVSAEMGSEPDEIFCAIGSGTLLQGILQGTETAKVFGVQVGAELSIKANNRLTILHYHKPFEYVSRFYAPFPSCANYDLKAWEYCLKYKAENAKTLFWNVL